LVPIMEKFFKFKENGTTFMQETIAGITTFFAMSYILFVNPAILSQTGMPFQAVFLATIIAAAVGTLIMGLFANVPYAQAPGMGMNAFFTYTVCSGLGYSWQEALAMVFVCGLVNIVITITKLRKLIIGAIPEGLQHAIGGGIGIFVAFVGIKSAGLLNFTADEGSYVVGKSGTMVANSSIIPALVRFNTSSVILSLFGIIFTTILVVKNVRGAFLLGIVASTIIAIPMNVVDFSAIDWHKNSLNSSIEQLGVTFGAAFSKEGVGALFNDPARIPMALMTILAFSLSDIFDTIGTFIGTGRRSGIFSKKDEEAASFGRGLKTKMDKALFADAIATAVGSVIGTSNVTTFVESSAGIAAGGRTGFTSVVTAILFILSSFLSPLINVVPTQATASSLILVGIFMLASFADVKWTQVEEAIPAFFASIFMAFAYSISYGIAAGFIFFTLIKIIKGKLREVHPIVLVIDLLFIINFAIMANLKFN